MPKKLADLKEEDIDPRIMDTAKDVGVKGGPPIIGAVSGILTCAVTTTAIDKFANEQAENQRETWRYGLKGLATTVGLVEIAAALGMRDGKGKTMALVGGATYVAGNAVDMGKGFLMSRGIDTTEVLGKDSHQNAPKPWSPKAPDECGEQKQPPRGSNLRGK